MNTLDFRLYSVITLCGPTNAGKSFFARNVLLPTFRDHDYRVVYLSSDDIRRSLLDSESHKYDPEMLHVSKKAFDYLHFQIENAAKFPHPAHFIVVDTTGLSPEFRDLITKQCKEINYHNAIVLFDYKKMDEYAKYVNDGTLNKRLISKHLERMRTDVYPSLNKRDYDTIHKIKDKNFSEVQVVVSEKDKSLNLRSNLLCDDYKIDVVGDIHGCYDELVILLSKLGYKIDDDGRLCYPQLERHLVLVGDLVDKGPKSKDVVDFVAKNLELIHVVLGNHENFVNKYLQGELEDTGMTEDVQAQYFDTSFSKDESFKEKLQLIVHNSTPYLQNNSLIVTHAPCQNRHLGKTDRYSVKNQVNQRFPRREDDETDDQYTKKLEEHFAYLKEDAESSYPWHVFGHVAMKTVLQKGNKLGIDTGCVNGGYLTAVTLSKGSRRPVFTSVKCLQEGGYKPESLVSLFANERMKRLVDESNLDPYEIRRIDFITKNKINFVSGTMAPAESDPETNSIESLDKCFDYFRKSGVNKLIIQPKYMGSRCNVYLYKDLAKCFAVSRNGFRIREPDKGGPDLKKVYEKLQERFASLLSTDDDLVIFDGELMPWHALGAGLIEESFKPVEVAVDTELSALERLGFETVLNSTISSEDYANYRNDRNSLKKEELKKKYGDAKSGSYSVLYGYSHKPISQMREFLTVFKEQLELFGQPGEPEFRPFSILKSRYKGVEVVGAENNSIFHQISEDSHVVFDLEKPDEVQRAREFFEFVTMQKKMEGVVVKPLKYTGVCAPYMKVRSPRYLTIVYGYDYLHPEKLTKLVNSKRTGGKLRTSITEFNIGLEMLRTPQEHIKPDNASFRALCARMIAEEKSEKKFDPRL